MHRLYFVLLFLVLLFSAVIYFFIENENQQTDYALPNNEPIAVALPAAKVSRTAVLNFKPGTSEKAKNSYVKSIKGKIIQEISGLDSIVVKLPKGISIKSLPKAKILASKEPDYFLSALDYEVNDPDYDKQWALPAVGAPKLWEEYFGHRINNEKTKVAVIDSGVCLSHPDLKNSLVEGYDFIENDNSPQDEFGHGCGVAGVIAARINNDMGIAGLSPNAEIMPVRVLDKNGVGTYSGVAQGIVWSVDHGAKVINLSLGGTNSSSLLESSINYAKAHDVTVVAAAGNTGNSTVLYPAKYESVIAVGSVDLSLQKSAFSSSGSEIDIWAPGRDIYTTSLNGGYNYMSGTSLASPVVAGMKILDKDFSGVEVVESNDSATNNNNSGSNAILSASLDNSGYPYITSSPGQADKWSMFTRNCTSYVAWRINKDRGITSGDTSQQYFKNTMTGPNNNSGTFSDAHNWDNNAQTIGFNVDNNPERGEVAVWEINTGAGMAVGHVAYVESVNTNGTVNVSEYNMGSESNNFTSHNYGTRNGVTADHYIHINNLDQFSFDLTGRVRYNSDNSLATNVTVKLQHLDWGFVNTAFTDSLGMYSFSHIPAGRIILSADNGSFSSKNFQQQLTDVNMSPPPVLNALPELFIENVCTMGQSLSQSTSSIEAASCVPSNSIGSTCPNGENGTYCGASLGLNANTLYQCNNGVSTPIQTCGISCIQKPPGVADVCATTNWSGSCPSGNGDYCGSTLDLDPNKLYTCTNGSVSEKQICGNGCQLNPPGTPDLCYPTGEGSGGDTGGKVRLYGDSNYGSSSLRLELGTGEYNTPSKSTLYKSLELPSGWSAITYDQPLGQTSNTRCWSSSEPLLENHGWQDRIDAIKVYPKNVCPGENSWAKICQGTGMQNCLEVKQNMPSLGNGGFVNDSLKSVDIEGSWEITLFEDDNYQGRKIFITLDSNDIQSDYGSFGYNSSSIQVRKKDPVAFTLFSLGDHGGTRFTSDRAVPDLDSWKNPENNQSWDNTAKSLGVTSGYEVILCTDKNYRGFCRRYSSDQNNIGQELEAKVSSVQVCQGTCPVGPAIPANNTPNDQESFVTGSPIVFSWVGNSQEYLLEYWGGDLGGVQTSGPIKNSQTWAKPDLSPSVNPYHWHVKAFNPYGESSWGEEWSFYIEDIAIETVSIGGPAQVNLGANQVYTANINPTNATTPVTYYWDPEPKSGQGTASATYKWNNPGDITISVSAGNHAGTRTDSKNVNVTCTGSTPNIAEYFNNKTLSGSPVLVGCEGSNIFHNWYAGGPGFPVDGDLVVDSGETFYTDSEKTPLTANSQAGSNTISVANASGFSPGDEILIIQMQRQVSGAGDYEYRIIQSIDSNTITFTSNLTNSYDTTNPAKAQAMKIFRYRNVDILDGGKITAQAWDGSTGGVVAFKAYGLLNIENGAAVDTSGLGFRGAPRNNTTTMGYPGEGQTGPALAPGGQHGMGGGGGCSDGYGELAGGGGGGHGTTGSNGNAGSGNGCNSGGAGGGIYGMNELNIIIPGGGGGAGGAKVNDGPENYGGEGGAGGGVVMIFAENIQLDGEIRSNGANGAGIPSGRGGGRGGAGAGGSIKIERNQGNIDNNKLIVQGGTGGGVDTNPGSSQNGGNGGLGRKYISQCIKMGCSQDNFSGRWTQTKTFTQGMYDFNVWTDDGVRLWVNQELLIDRWIDGVTNMTVSKFMTTGQHIIKIEYYENGGNAYVTSNITLKPNNPPVVATIPGQTIAEDTQFTTFDLDNYGSDPDSWDQLTWSFSGNTQLNVSKDAANVVTITSPANWFGQENITFTATDTAGAQASSTALFKVNAVNDAPVITSTALTQAYINEAYNYDVDATDVDNPTLTYGLSQAPTGMSINSASGLISWTPAPADIGNRPVSISVSDGTASAQQSFTLNVSYNPDNFVSNIDEHFVNATNWFETPATGFTMSIDAEKLKVYTTNNNNSTKKISSKFVTVTNGTRYYLYTKMQTQNADSPKVQIELYDINFVSLGVPKTITGSAGTSAMRDYSTSYIIPSTYGGKAVKFAKINLISGDIRSTAIGSSATTWFDDVYFSTTNRP